MGKIQIPKKVSYHIPAEYKALFNDCAERCGSRHSALKSMVKLLLDSSADGVVPNRLVNAGVDKMLEFSASHETQGAFELAAFLHKDVDGTLSRTFQHGILLLAAEMWIPYEAEEGIACSEKGNKTKIVCKIPNEYNDLFNLCAEKKFESRQLAMEAIVVLLMIELDEEKLPTLKKLLVSSHVKERMSVGSSWETRGKFDLSARLRKKLDRSVAGTCQHGILLLAKEVEISYEIQPDFE